MHSDGADDDTLRKMADRIQVRAVRRCGELLKTFNSQGRTRIDECSFLLLNSAVYVNIPSVGDSPRSTPNHSHSIVPGGFDVTSYTTRLMPCTSLMIRVAVRLSTSWGNSKNSAVIPSVEVTARSAHTLS